ncbi:MAG: CRTAC1 family protein [Planctomycetes bacterium]|nr:CRTAC1 family protein [Planctomycetota bacterium]
MDRAAEAGLVHVNHTGVFHEKPTIIESKGAGVLTLDYDGDGLLDLYFVDGNHFRLDPTGRVSNRKACPEAMNHLYRNLGGLRFVDTTLAAGVGDRSFGLSGTVGDYDNDGDPDIYVCNWGENVLYRNNGDGTFTDVAGAAGVAGPDDRVSMCAAFFDADGDGDLDLYVSNTWEFDARLRREGGGIPGVRRDGLWIYAGPLCFDATPHTFYRNRGDGSFEDDSARALAGQGPGYGMQAIPFDPDDDGDTDVFVANDSTANFLWVNDGSGHFTDRALAAGVALDAAGCPQAGMGVDAGDMNGDDRIDLVVTTFSNESVALWRNISEEGEPVFEDITSRSRLTGPTWWMVSWGVALRDFDLDGCLDLFSVNGGVYPTAGPDQRLMGATYEEPSLFLRGEGPPDWRFHDASAESGPGLAIRRLGRAATFADLDDDGDLDVVVACLNSPPLLLENRLPRRGHWLGVKLAGKRSNRDGIGTRVRVTAGGGAVRQSFDHSLAGSFGAARDPRVFFGLGAAEKADLLSVRWPSGLVQEFRDLSADRVYHLTEGCQVSETPGRRKRGPVVNR